MSKRKSKKKTSKRQQSVMAWKKETKRLLSWARRLEKEGFIVSFNDVDLEVPKRITQRKLQELQAIRGRSIYSHVTISAAPWSTAAQASAYANLNIQVGESLSYHQIRSIRAEQRAYIGDDDIDAEFNAIEVAFANCIAALSKSGYNEAENAIAFLHEYHNDETVRHNILHAESRIIEECNAMSFESKQYNRKAAYSAFIELLLGEPISLEFNYRLTPQ